MSEQILKGPSLFSRCMLWVEGVCLCVHYGLFTSFSFHFLEGIWQTSTQYYINDKFLCQPSPKTHARQYSVPEFSLQWKDLYYLCTQNNSLVGCGFSVCLYHCTLEGCFRWTRYSLPMFSFASLGTRNVRILSSSANLLAKIEVDRSQD